MLLTKTGDDTRLGPFVAANGDRRRRTGLARRVEYSLTETGLTLRPVLDAMWAWGEGYKERLREGSA